MYKRYWSAVTVFLALAVAIGCLRARTAMSSTGRNSTGVDDQVCDPTADYYLGIEDYPRTIQLHQRVIRSHPGFALAYYHLGFAYGVLGDHRRELIDYQKAIELGLSDWSLFLNLGRLYLETNRLDQARDMHRAVTDGANHDVSR